METTSVLIVLVAVIAGVIVGATTMRSHLAAPLAAATAERDLLLARVVDLESVVADTGSTAATVAPLAVVLERVERQVRELEHSRTTQFAEVAQRLVDVSAGAARLGDETARLVGSLNSSSVRGHWGEVQLRRVLEHAGMLGRCDFTEQQVGTNAAGSAIRPDVVVHLPGDRHVVIDAKAPMTAFLAAQADDLGETRRQAHLRDHAKTLRGHVDTLSGKEYWTGLVGSPEFVVCFVPGDAILGAALAKDPELHDYAMGRKVVLASPGTLMALLRSVAYAWQQDSLTVNARQVYAVGRELYARLAALAGHTSRLGTSLTRSVEAYNAMIGSLESRVLVSARRLADLGVATDQLAQPPTISDVTRPLTAGELLNALEPDVARPQLDLDGAAGTYRPVDSPEAAGRYSA